MSDDICIFLAFCCHAVRAVLAHANAVAEAFRRNNDFIPSCFHVKSEERKSNFSRTSFLLMFSLEMLRLYALSFRKIFNISNLPSLPAPSHRDVFESQLR